MTLAELNALDRTAFVEAVGFVFEHSPWVAERAWSRRPFASLEALHSAMSDEVSAAGMGDQLALLCAHPDLGARARMTEASIGEQTGAGLDRLTPSQFEQLRGLNDTYRERFGFPFLLAVKGCTAADVLDALGARVTAAKDDELAEALRQVGRIARFRLEGLVRE